METDTATTDTATTDTATEQHVSDSTLDETPATEPTTEQLEAGPVVDLARGLEAIFMVADEPQSLVSLATALNAPVAKIRKSITSLCADFDGEGEGPQRGFELREVGGGWRIYVRAEYDAAVRDFVFTQNPSRLSQAALETLAVIAYKQPISRGAVAAVRAVNVDSVVRTLLGRGLITEAFTDNETGAIHYETTELMLVQLGINSIAELPPISPLLSDGSDGFDEQR